MRRENLVNQTFSRQFDVGAVAANATTSEIIDLGPRHNYRTVSFVKRGAPSPGETLLVWQSFNGDAETPAWSLAPKDDLSDVNASPASSAQMFTKAAPGARWLKFSHVNGSTAQTVLKLEVTLFPT